MIQVMSVFTLHRGAFCQFSFRCIYYCHCSKSIRKKTGKTHLCALRNPPIEVEFCLSKIKCIGSVCFNTLCCSSSHQVKDGSTFWAYIISKIQIQGLRNTGLLELRIFMQTLLNCTYIELSRPRFLTDQLPI